MLVVDTKGNSQSNVGLFAFGERKMAKEIKLTQGQVAIVDDEDFNRVNKLKWYALEYKEYNPPQFLAARSVRLPNGKRGTQLMHRFVMMCDFGDGNQVDHINHDTLNNQKDNLRICTGSQNMYNQNTKSNNSSGYKGVSFHKQTAKYKAQITFNKKQIHLGLFATPDEASEVYQKAAIELHGEFANWEHK